jgi:hypothetical protein
LLSDKEQRLKIMRSHIHFINSIFAPIPSGFEKVDVLAGSRNITG